MTAREDALLIVAEVTGVYGIKGWVKLRSFTEVAQDLFGYDGYRICSAVDFRSDGSLGTAWRDLVIDQGKAHGRGLIARFAGVTDRDAAEQLRGSLIAVPKTALQPLTADEFYWHQLEGLQVYAGERCLGRVDHLIETGANDVLVVSPEPGTANSVERGKASSRERLIPWVYGDVVQHVDLEGGTIQVNWDPEF